LAKKPTLLVALLVHTPALWCHGIAIIAPHRGRRRKLNTQDGRKPRPSDSVPKINTLDYQLEEGTAGAGVENTSLAIAQDRVRVLFTQQAEAAHLPRRTILDPATLMNCNAQAIPPNHVREASNTYDCFRGATTRQICALCKGIFMAAQSGVDIRTG
jgi:hypothetical protein